MLSKVFQANKDTSQVSARRLSAYSSRLGPKIYIYLLTSHRGWLTRENVSQNKHVVSEIVSKRFADTWGYRVVAERTIETQRNRPKWRSV